MVGQLRFVECEQELFLVGLDAFEESVEDDDAGLASKAAVEALFDLSPEGRPGLLGVLHEFAVDDRDVAADRVDPRLGVRGNGWPLPEEPVDVTSAEGVILTEVERTGAITQDDGAVMHLPVLEERAEAGTLGGDEAGPLAADPQLIEVTVPCPSVLGSALPLCQLLEGTCAESVVFPVMEGVIVDHMILEPAAEQVDEVEPAAGVGGSEDAEAVIAQRGTVAGPAHVAVAGIVDREP